MRFATTAAPPVERKMEGKQQLLHFDSSFGEALGQWAKMVCADHEIYWKSPTETVWGVLGERFEGPWGPWGLSHQGGQEAPGDAQNALKTIENVLETL